MEEPPAASPSHATPSSSADAGLPALSSADLDAIRRQLIELQVARDAVTAPYFDAIQAFLDRQRADAGPGSGTEQPSGGLEVVN
jgi:hypothetical protein